MNPFNKLNNRTTKTKPWLFLGVTLGLTWAFEFLAAFLDGIIPKGAVTSLLYLGGLMPLLVALSLVCFKQDRPFQKDFFNRIFELRRIGIPWFAVIFLFAPIKSSLAAFIDILLGGWGMAPEEITRLLDQPIMIFPTLIFWMIFGPIPEEPGWRGYALEGLQAKLSAFLSSLIVGGVWSLWHLPLFFIKGTWQADVVGLGTQRFWLYLLSILLEAVLYTWIYNHTDRSILAAILFHFVGNSFGELFELSPRAEMINFVLLLVSVGVVLLIWGPKKLSKPKPSIIT